MSFVVPVIVLVVVVGIVLGVSLASRRQRENPLHSLEGLKRKGLLDMQDGGQGEIVELLTREQKIAAIKRYREMTGVGLVEAKAAVEQMERESLMGPGAAMGVQPFMGGAGNLADQEVRAELFKAEVQQLVMAGKKIEAIKLYRAMTGASLAEAKAAIDRIG